HLAEHAAGGLLLGQHAAELLGGEHALLDEGVADAELLRFDRFGYQDRIFRPYGAFTGETPVLRAIPRLAPWATFLRRSAATGNSAPRCWRLQNARTAAPAPSAPVPRARSCWRRRA